MHGPERFGKNTPAPLFNSLPEPPEVPADDDGGNRQKTRDQVERDLLAMVVHVVEVSQSLADRVEHIEREMEAMTRRLETMEHAMEVH